MAKLSTFLKTVNNAVGGGVEVVDSDGPVALGTGAGGDLKFATKEKTLHLYNGANWIQMSGANEGPVVQISPSAIETQGGNATKDSATATFKAIDPDGWNISYDVNFQHDSSRKFYPNDSSNLPPQLLHPAQITLGSADSNGAKTATYRFLTSGATAAGMKESDGSGNNIAIPLQVRYIATDGLRSTSVVRQFSITYSVSLDFELTGWSSYNGTYTNSFTVTTSSTAGVQGPILRNGKRYMEILIGAISGGVGSMFGFGKAGGGMGWANNTTKQWYNNTGNLYGIGGYEQSFNLNYAQGDRMMLAWDTDNNKCWFGLNGTWGTNHNPATEAGHALPTGDLTDALCLSFSSGTQTPSFSGTVKMGNDLTYSIPSGFETQ